MASFTRGGRKPYARSALDTGADGQWMHDKAPGSEKANGTFGKPKASTLSSSMVTSKIIVKNLHYEIMSKDLTSIFGQIGTLVREPLIRYDNSGRSKGEAVVTFESPAEATRAKNQFEGILAKGQPMSIGYYTPPPRPHRSSSAPTASLLQRIQKPPLLDRLGRDDSDLKPSERRTTGPIRPRQTRQQRSKPVQKKIPKTAEELDKELDAFMGDPSTLTNNSTPAAAQEKGPESTAQDVEMA